MRWLLRKVFPYIDILETENSRLRKRNRLLLDRILMMTTGAPLVLPAQPTEETPEMAEALKKRLAADQPFNDRRTFAEIMADLEAESFQKDAGIESNTSEAFQEQNDREITEEDEKREKALKSNLAAAVGRAKAEYLYATQPVRPEESN